jgi:hypothetical protein
VHHRYQRQFATGVNDTSGKIAANINDTQRQILPPVSLVLLLPVANLAVATTLVESTTTAANLPPVANMETISIYIYLFTAQMA